MMNNTVYIASYPKTGSTWVKIIVNMIISPDSDDVIHSFQKEFPKDVSRFMFRNENKKFIKTHLLPGHKRMNGHENDIAAAIIVNRHPLDILLSSLNYSRVRGCYDYFLSNQIKTVEDIIACGEIEYYINKLIENRGFSPYSGSSGELFSYVDTWQDHCAIHKIPTLLLRYEEMVNDPRRAIVDIHNFMEYPLSEVDKILDASQTRSEKKGIFFWKKKSYNYREMLNPKLTEQFFRIFCKKLIKMGYDPHF